MRTRTVVFGVLGVLATAWALALALAPDLLLAVGPLERAITWLADLEPKRVMLAGALVVVLYAALAARRPRETEGDPDGVDAATRFRATASEPPEAVTADRRPLTGARLDAELDRALAGDGRDVAAVRSTLADLAVDAYADAARVSTARARDDVRAGRWTTDPVAAAFLAAEGGPTPSLAARMRLWLTPTAERRRRVERTLAAVQDLLTEEQR